MKGNRKTKPKRLLSMLLVLMMVLTLMPATASATGGRAIQLVDSTKHVIGGISGYDKTNGYNYIYFGKWNNSPIKWRVLDTKTNMNTKGLFLLSDALLGTGEDGNVIFDDGILNNN